MITLIIKVIANIFLTLFGINYAENKNIVATLFVVFLILIVNAECFINLIK